jgi:hypothetical protein
MVRLYRQAGVTASHAVYSLNVYWNVTLPRSNVERYPFR